MALKIILLRRSLDLKNAALEALEQEGTALQTRSQELEAAIGEAETQEHMDALAAEVETLNGQKEAHKGKCEALRSEIAKLEQEIAALEAQEPKAPATDPTPALTNNPETERSVRTMNNNPISIRSLPMGVRAFDALSPEVRSQTVAREDVKSFLTRFRDMIRERRSVTGGELTIPEHTLGLVAENLYRYSKLMPHVNVRTIKGSGRQTIMGTVPEAVWTEMCAKINELTLGFSQVTVDGYKVAGFIPVCNALLEDNDVDLYGWLVEALSTSVAMAIDRAILYGKGASGKMPMGIVTRLAQTAKPSDYPANGPAWTNLSATNVVKLAPTSSTTAQQFWQLMVDAAAKITTPYAQGSTFWAMNPKTYAKLQGYTLGFNSAGAIVSGMGATMPIIGGSVVLVDFIPDNDIIGGYGQLYLLAQRSGMAVDASSHVRFTEDETVFRGKMRCDGTPVIAQGFVAINIANTAVTTTSTFPTDSANAETA